MFWKKDSFELSIFTAILGCDFLQLSNAMVELVCTGLTEAKSTMAHLAFHNIQGITDFPGISPIRLNSDTCITTLSLARNNLNDSAMEKILDYWRKNSPTITKVILQPGNDGLSQRYVDKVQCWIEGREDEAEEQEKAESEGNTTSSESETEDDSESATQSKASTTVSLCCNAVQCLTIPLTSQHVMWADCDRNDIYQRIGKHIKDLPVLCDIISFSEILVYHFVLTTLIFYFFWIGCILHHEHKTKNI